MQNCGDKDEYGDNDIDQGIKNEGVDDEEDDDDNDDEKDRVRDLFK